MTRYEAARQFHDGRISSIGCIRCQVNVMFHRLLNIFSIRISVSWRNSVATCLGYPEENRRHHQACYPTFPISVRCMSTSHFGLYVRGLHRLIPSSDFDWSSDSTVRLSLSIKRLLKHILFGCNFNIRQTKWRYYEFPQIKFGKIQTSQRALLSYPRTCSLTNSWCIGPALSR